MEDRTPQGKSNGWIGNRNSPSSDEDSNSWLHQIIRQCGEAIGISLESNKGGWKDLVEYAKSREKENREAFATEKSKRKGSRELQSLVCSINYDRTAGGHVADPGSSKVEKRIKGSIKVSK